MSVYLGGGRANAAVGFSRAKPYYSAGVTAAVPNPPTGLTVTGTTGSTVTLDWNDSSDLIAGDKYQIYLDDQWPGSIESVTSSYTYTGLSAGQTYQFRVGAGQSGRYSPWSAPVPGTTTGSPPSTAINRPSNPFLILYGDTAPALTYLNQWSVPGALVIVGRNNYNQSWVHTLAGGGCTVLIYLHPQLMNTVGRYHDLLYNASQFGGAVPGWPGGPWVIDQYGNLADFRVGSLLNTKLSGVLNLMVTENPHISGFFFDGVGSRHYPGIGGFSWDSWSSAQRLDYYNGAVAQMQIARGIADTNNLMCIVNGTWQAGNDQVGGGYPDRNAHGCSLVDGGMIENHPADINGFHWAYANLPTNQWGLAIPRIAAMPIPRGYMITTNQTTAERDQWIALNAMSHCHGGDFQTMTAPWRSFTDFHMPNRQV